MKKILSVIVCFIILSFTFMFTSAATPELTLDEAEDLIRQLVDFKATISGDISDSKYNIVLTDLHGDAVTDTAILSKLRVKMGLDENDDGLRFYELKDEYGKASFWFDRLKNFLAEHYVDEHIVLRRAVLQLGDYAYSLESAGYMGAPDFPYTKSGKTIKECITFVDGDTVIFEANYGYEDTRHQIDFEYTEKGWRISGGDGAKLFLRSVYAADAKNPETFDGIVPITVCLAVSMLCIGTTVNKRRYSSKV